MDSLSYMISSASEVRNKWPNHFRRNLPPDQGSNNPVLYQVGYYTYQSSKSYLLASQSAMISMHLNSCHRKALNQTFRITEDKKDGDSFIIWQSIQLESIKTLWRQIYYIMGKV